MQSHRLSIVIRNLFDSCNATFALGR